MKKRIALLLSMAMTLSLGTSVSAEAFNPDKVEDAMSIEQVREKLGEEVPVEKDIQLGAIAKSFSNEF